MRVRAGFTAETAVLRTGTLPNAANALLASHVRLPRPGLPCTLVELRASLILSFVGAMDSQVYQRQRS